MTSWFARGALVIAALGRRGDHRSRAGRIAGAGRDDRLADQREPRVIDWRWTDGSGNYRFTGLAAVPHGYQVCVSAPPFGATKSTDTGLSGQCFLGSLWRRPLDPVSR